jgi:hypothetical protein
MLTLTEVVTPSAPSAGEIDVHPNSADHRLKYIDENGLLHTLSSVEWPKNNIINGGFNFAQRQVAGTLTTYSQTASRAYAADRWFLSNENASLQFQQIDTITATETNYLHRYYGKYKKITNAGKFAIGQIISAENMAPLRGQRVRLTCWMKRTVAAAMSVRLGLVQGQAAGTQDSVPGYVSGAPSGTFISAWGAVGTDPTLGTNLARINPVTGSQDGGTISGGGLTCVLGAAWVRYSVCVDVPTDAENLIFMVWTDGQPAANDELNIGQCMLTQGVEIPDWVAMPQVYELNRCYRFYQKTFPLNTAPAQSGGVSGALRGGVVIAGAVATSSIMQWRFPVPFRATPTLTFFNPSAANAFVRNVPAATDASVTAAANTTQECTDINCTGAAGWTVGQEIKVHATADAEL